MQSMASQYIFNVAPGIARDAAYVALIIFHLSSVITWLRLVVLHAKRQRNKWM